MSVISRHNPYVIVVAGVEDPEILGRIFGELRKQFGMRQSAELHGHSMSEEMLLEVLECTEEVSPVVGALVIDKASTREFTRISEIPSPSDCQVASALRVVEMVFARYMLRELRCDEDIRGKRQKQFLTEVKRRHRTAWPETQIKVQCLPSEKSDLIQLADVIAYGLGVFTRGTIQNRDLERKVVQLRERKRNSIEGPRAW